MTPASATAAALDELFGEVDAKTRERARSTDSWHCNKPCAPVPTLE